MGSVLLLGATHYPPLMGTDADMAWVLGWTLEDPDIPEQLRSIGNWPRAMQEEYGDDKGEASAKVHRAALLESFGVIREAIDDFRPDAVVIWGDDQYENFREDLIPPFSVLAYDDVVATPFAKASRTNVWGESSDTSFSIKGAQEIGIAMASALLDREIDVAYAYQPLHHPSLPHSFLNTILLLDYDRRGFPYPVLPIAVNCYGRRIISYRGGLSRLADRTRRLDPSGPSPKRCMALGAAAAEFAVNSPWRIAFIASSSWSHAFLTDHTYRLYPDTEADRNLFDALISGEYGTWRNYTTLDIEHSGQQEVLNWFCLAGAAEQLGILPDWSKLVETYVFNSNKAFVQYPLVSNSV